MAQRPSYVSVPGSVRLITRARGQSAAAPVEAAAPSSLKKLAVDVPGGHVVVGPALLQGKQVPLLVDVTDRLAPLLSVESFAVYMHLYRLAVGEGKNVTRISLGELARRCRLQGRRLNKAIADAVDAGAIALVDRTRDGTLYRVALPAELLGDDDGAPATRQVIPLAAPAPAPSPSTAKTPPRSASPSPNAAKPPPASAAKAPRASSPKQPASSAKAPRASSPKPPASSSTSSSPAPPPSPSSSSPRSVGDVCRWFEAAYGQSPGRRGPDVASAVMALLEDGHTFAVIPDMLSSFVQTAPKSAPLSDVGRYRS